MVECSSTMTEHEHENYIVNSDESHVNAELRHHHQQDDHRHHH